MNDYLLNKRPRITIYLILILFVSYIIIQISSQIGALILLYPSNLGEPWNWYRLITYSLYIRGFNTWFFISLSLLCYGYIIENRIQKTDLVGLILISSIVGGLLSIVFNQNSEFDMAIGSPSMIAWGYSAATIVIGIRFWKSLNLFEKIIFGFALLEILIIWKDNLGFFFSKIIVIILIMIYTIIKVKKWTGHNTVYKP